MADNNTIIKAIDSDKEWMNKLKSKKTVTKVEIPRGYGRKQVDERWKVALNQNEKYMEYQKQSQKAAVGLGDQYQIDVKKELLDEITDSKLEVFKDNIENFIGTVKVPLGIAGPVRVNGLNAQGDFLIPLATTEAALVASIARGISCINQAGGATAAVISEAVNRDPVFTFRGLAEAAQFAAWASKQFQFFKQAAETSTRHGKLVDMRIFTEGKDVHLRFMYTSGDASGQNMVTIATERVLEYIIANMPTKPQSYLIEGGMSGDKKGNINVMTSVRGKKVIAEVIVPSHIVETTLHVTATQMAAAAQIGGRALFMVGAIGQSLHFSNALTAMAIATGQDPACAAESHVGIARCELLTESNSLYISVTLPNMLCATVGGGTKLPSQRACLELMGLYGAGKANALAEVMATVLIAGELSLGAAVISGDFAKAHKILARDTSTPINLDVDTLEEAFDKAQALLVKLSNLPSKDDILNIYGLYKQSTVGDVNISKPSWLSTDLKARAKYSAWESKKGVSKKDAMREYIKLVQKLADAEKTSGEKKK